MPLITKKEYSAVDAGPIVLYGKKDTTSDLCQPVTISSTGTLLIGGSSRENKVDKQTTLTTTASVIVLASVSTVFLDVYGVIVANTSASAAVVRFQDNATFRFDIGVPAGETRGFMLPESGAVKAAAVTTNWNATLDAAVSSVEVTVLGLKNS